ncbi:hypothetical protein [Polynucleobacter necessarius]|uniref:hypothetical protein n=1 Tax=Polynucleobacter necessarius TaxID=576610 RepID=UPI000E08DBE5|nr:hypothetical protein [Polynucleobacter necessarius]HAT39058.1 hypothetical protein [Polynucleobacter sp.]
MSRFGKMPGWHRLFLICGIVTCSITGLIYLLGHHFQIQRSTLGSHSILATHGVAKILASLAFRSVLPFHIKAGYKSQRQWLSGFSLIGYMTILIISAALLSYGPEDIRDIAMDTHWVVGLLFFATFLVHVFIRLGNSKRTQQ